MRVGGVVKSYNYSSKATIGIIGQSIVISPTQLSLLCKTRTNCKLVLGVCSSYPSALVSAVSISDDNNGAHKLQSDDSVSNHAIARGETDAASISATDATLGHPVSEGEVKWSGAAMRATSTSTSTTTYTVVYNMESSITVLIDSLPVAGTCSEATGSYYRYSIAVPDKVST